MENNKPLEEKTIIERHTKEGKFHLTTSLIEMDTRLKTQNERLKRAEEALEFLAVWWEENFGNKLILPSQEQINQIKLIK